MLREQASPIGQTFDYLIVGSGFGGAITACRLAQAMRGSSVAILERGKEYSADTDQEDGPFREALKWDVFKDFSVLRASGVGGGSLVYFNVRIRAQDWVFDQEVWPEEINSRSLGPYYDLAKGMLAHAPLPVERMPVRTQEFQRAVETCDACGEIQVGKPRLMDIAVHSSGDPTVGSQDPAVQQHLCTYCGECLVGCPRLDGPSNEHVNAKSVLPLNYLAVAHSHGAKIFSDITAKEIHRNASSNIFEVVVEEGLPDQRVGEKGVVKARNVILGAGSLGSTEILLRSKDKLGIAGCAVGRKYSGNGDFLIPKTVNVKRDLGPTSGPTITAGAEFVHGSVRMLIQDLGQSEGLLSGVYERAVGDLSREIEPDSMGYLGMGNDAADGVMSLVGDRLSIAWDPDGEDNRKLYDAFTEVLKDMSDALGGDYQPPESLQDNGSWEGLPTAHPLGGCPMGESCKEGVVNHEGKVFDGEGGFVEGLYVADGAIIPTALGVNPSYTISALAERVAFRIVNPGHELGDPGTWTPENPSIPPPSD